MTDRATWARARRQRQQEPVKRALLLMVLGLDPGGRYTPEQLHGAWRRRRAHLHVGDAAPGGTAAAVDAAYATLAGAPAAGPPLSLEL